MTKRKFIRTLAILNFLVIGIFLFAAYMVSDFLQSSAASRVAGVSTRNSGRHYDSIAFGLGGDDEDLYFTYQQNDRVEILKYRTFNTPESVADFIIANPLLSLDTQVVEGDNGIFFIQAGLLKDEVIFLDLEGGQSEVFSYDGNINSLYYQNGQLTMLLRDTIEGKYLLQRLELASKSNTNIGTLDSENLYQLKEKQEDYYLEDIAQQECFLFDNDTDLFAEEECIYVNDYEIDNFIVNRVELDKNKGEEDVAEDKGQSLPDSFPQEPENFVDKIYGYDKDELILLYTGEDNGSLEVVGYRADRLYVISSKEQDTKFVELDIGGEKVELKNTIDFPQEAYRFLFADLEKGLIYLDLPSSYEEEYYSHLFVLDIQDAKWFEYELPDCPLTVDICRVEYVSVN